MTRKATTKPKSTPADLLQRYNDLQQYNDDLLQQYNDLQQRNDNLLRSYNDLLKQSIESNESQYRKIIALKVVLAELENEVNGSQDRVVEDQ